ncbi:MAG: flagellar hook-basal body complex protein FliE [Chloroflexi bacterium]|nr:flagellar hook-basal body complex protein FliE [Chloroflexota bacterium]
MTMHEERDAASCPAGRNGRRRDEGMNQHGDPGHYMMGKLSETERGTNDLVTRAAAGENVDIADVMIATQAESLAFQVGIQVRNKLVEAYQEVFRMSV